MKERLGLTTRALGEAESLVETLEADLQVHKNILLLSEEKLEAERRYYEEYNKEYKKSVNKKILKTAVIALAVGILVGVMAAI